MIHNYKEFCKYYDLGLVDPDIKSDLGLQSVNYLIKIGWEVNFKNLLGLPKKTQISKKLLSICSQSEENFETAYKHSGIDFSITQ